MDGFRVDLDSDLVSAAGAHTADATFGDVLGGRSLHFKGDIDDLEHLVDLSRQGLARFRSADYRRRFKWIDNMTPVSDNATVDDLRHKLVDAILQPVIPNSIDVLIPDDLVATDDSRAVEFIAYPRERRSSEGRKTLTIEMVQQLLTRLEEFSPGSSLDAELRFFDAADELLGTTSVLDVSLQRCV